MVNLMKLNALTIDVEDYFQVNAFAENIRFEEWGNYPLRVGDNASRILDMLDEFGVKATFFVLGWVAERLPKLVHKIEERGHEVGCHGYAHELVYRIGPDRFRKDVRSAKRIIEDIVGKQVLGYRAPSYSITKQSLWALDILVEEGFTYDSSIFPVHHDVYGVPGSERFPYEIVTPSGGIKEFPISTYPLSLGQLQARLPMAGGGYLRLLPMYLLKGSINYINNHEHQPVVIYFHPWEIDPDQPRIRAGFRSTFRHYINLHKTETKVRSLLHSFRFTTMQTVLDSMCRQGQLKHEN